MVLSRVISQILLDGTFTLQARALSVTERLRTGNFRWPPQAILPVPYYRLEGSAIAIWRCFPSKLDSAPLAPANCSRN